MNDATGELLSRYLDDDLGVSQRLELEARLQHDDALVRELADLRALRADIREYAGSVTAPSELDVMLEPLRRAKSTERRFRPFYRIVAAAAVVIVGVIVGLEIAEQGPKVTEPEHGSKASTQSSLGNKEPFKLQPLPTTPPDQDDLVGATEHLLASPVAEPQLDEPPSLEIIGPLSTEEHKQWSGDAPRQGNEEAEGEIQDDSEMSSTIRGEIHKKRRERSAPTEMDAAHKDLAKPFLEQRSPNSDVALLSVGQRRFPCERCADLSPGTWNLWIEVRNQNIVGCRGRSEAPGEDEIACNALLGMSVPELSEGNHQATLTIQRKP